MNGPRSNFEQAATQGSSRGLLREVLGWLAASGKWWLLPVMIVLLLCGALMLLSGTAAAPFLYTLF